MVYCGMFNDLIRHRELPWTQKQYVMFNIYQDIGIVLHSSLLFHYLPLYGLVYRWHSSVLETMDYIIYRYIAKPQSSFIRPDADH